LSNNLQAWFHTLVQLYFTLDSKVLNMILLSSSIHHIPT
jgi:hypothetical protein